MEETADSTSTGTDRQNTVSTPNEASAVDDSSAVLLDVFRPPAHLLITRRRGQEGRHRSLAFSVVEQPRGRPVRGVLLGVRSSLLVRSFAGMGRKGRHGIQERLGMCCAKVLSAPYLSLVDGRYPEVREVNVGGGEKGEEHSTSPIGGGPAEIMQ